MDLEDWISGSLLYLFWIVALSFFFPSKQIEISSSSLAKSSPCPDHSSWPTSTVLITPILWSLLAPLNKWDSIENNIICSHLLSLFFVFLIFFTPLPHRRSANRTHSTSHRSSNHTLKEHAKSFKPSFASSLLSSKFMSGIEHRRSSSKRQIEFFWKTTDWNYGIYVWSTPIWISYTTSRVSRLSSYNDTVLFPWCHAFDLHLRLLHGIRLAFGLYPFFLC